MPKYVGALDQGTTSTRFMIFDHGGQVVAIHQKEHEQIYPKPGWVEHDPAEIWARSQEVIRGALDKAGITAADLAAVGITNQRETAIVWDKNTGKAVYNAIVWQDTRTDVIVNEFAGTEPSPAILDAMVIYIQDIDFLANPLLVAVHSGQEGDDGFALAVPHGVFGDPLGGTLRVEDLHATARNQTTDGRSSGRSGRLHPFSITSLRVTPAPGMGTVYRV